MYKVTKDRVFSIHESTVPWYDIVNPITGIPRPALNFYKSSPFRMPPVFADHDLGGSARWARVALVITTATP